MDIVLHAPMVFRGFDLNISASDKKVVENSLYICNILTELCKKHGLLGFVLHPYTWRKAELKKLSTTYENNREILEKNLNNKYPMFLENVPHQFFSDPKTVKEVITKHKVRLCLDLVHLYLTSKSDNEFNSSLRELSELNPYFHIADTTHDYQEKDSHACEIGTGAIDFEKVIPYLHYGVIEVSNRNEEQPKEMISSYQKLQKMVEEFNRFDRIIMPLPRGGEDFLGTALKVTKKGTIIHFYDFT